MQQHVCSSTTPRVKSTRKFTRHLLLQGKLKRRVKESEEAIRPIIQQLNRSSNSVEMREMRERGLNILQALLEADPGMQGTLNDMGATAVMLLRHTDCHPRPPPNRDTKKGGGSNCSPPFPKISN